jgi:rfaE bifunctional protein kinase chain/domain
MTQDRIQEILKGYDGLNIAIIGDFCLDRYFEIDPSRKETSIETGLEVHNVTRVRTQPGAAGTILNNLVALGIGEIHAIGFRGTDGEGWLLKQALDKISGVNTGHFLETDQRHTFTYSKPLVLEPGQAPKELNRLDIKNWSPTPSSISKKICEGIHAIADRVDAMIVMDQVDIAETGVITREVLACLGELQSAKPTLPVIADSRRSLKTYPNLTFKMNADELSQWIGATEALSPEDVGIQAQALVNKTNLPVFVSMADQGIVSASPGAPHIHEPSLPVRGPIDIVGAGDSVTANLCAALASGATPQEAMHLAMRAASCVIHQLGTTGTATRKDLLSVS